MKFYGFFVNTRLLQIIQHNTMIIYTKLNLSLEN